MLRLQYPLALVSSFSRWMRRRPWIYRLLSRLDLSELTAPADLVTKGARVLVGEDRPLPRADGTSRWCLTLRVCVCGCVYRWLASVWLPTCSAPPRR